MLYACVHVRMGTFFFGFRLLPTDSSTTIRSSSTPSSIELPSVEQASRGSFAFSEEYVRSVLTKPSDYAEVSVSACLPFTTIARVSLSLLII